jgi:hypothetical protein
MERPRLGRSTAAVVTAGLAVLAISSACAATPTPTAETVGSAAPPPSPAGQTACEMAQTPETGPAVSHVIVDYADFIRWAGREYLASSSETGKITEANLGDVVGSSRCSLSELNARTRREPPMPTDGDTGFLPMGTPIYAVHGWATDCRLAATHGGQLRVYLAQEPGGTYSRPAACALHP